MRLAAEHYGWGIPWDRISPKRKSDLRNHGSVLAFNRSSILTSRNVTDPTELRERLQIVGEKLVSLRDHLGTA
jgi:hypothetical protein